jgi:hypothetical protein
MTYSTVYLNGDIKFPFRLGEILYLEGTPLLSLLFHLCTMLLMGS